jgi:hypothetical protein
VTAILNRAAEARKPADDYFSDPTACRQDEAIPEWTK